MKRLHLVIGTLFLPTAISLAIVDTNENGLSDLWEQAHNNGDLFSETYDPQADPDQDGWTNAQEAAAGTDPDNPNPPDGIIAPDLLHTPAVMGTDGNGQPIIITPEVLTVSWPTQIGKQYTLLFSPDLSATSWLQVPASQFIGDGNIHEFNFETSSGDKCFWRVSVSDVDSDKDGLSDAEEHTFGTNSQDNDSDDDNLLDGEEVASGSDPNTQFSDLDQLPDGIDAVPNDALVDWERTNEGQYVLLDINLTENQTPRDLNDRGEILFDNGIWSNGSWLSLEPEEMSGVFPREADEEGNTLFESTAMIWTSFNNNRQLVGSTECTYQFIPDPESTVGGGEGFFYSTAAWKDIAQSQYCEELAIHLTSEMRSGSFNPLGIAADGRKAAVVSYVEDMNPDPEIDDFEDRTKLVVFSTSGGDPEFLEPPDDYLIDHNFSADTKVTSSGWIVCQSRKTTQPDSDEEPVTSFRMDLWKPDNTRVQLSGIDAYQHRYSLSDLPNGRLGITCVSGENFDGNVMLENSDNQLVQSANISSLGVQFFAGDGSAMTHDHKLWRNGKLTPMRDLCQRYGDLQDNGWQLRPLKANKQGVYLIAADGANGVVETKLGIPLIIERDEEGDAEEWKEISGKMAKALPGQKINLRLNLDSLPEGMTATDFTWAINGKHFEKYQANNSWAKLTETNQATLKKQKVEFYWAEPGIHTITVSCIINGQTAALSRTITVVKPVSRLSAALGNIVMQGNGDVELAGIQHGILFQGKVDSIKPEFDGEGDWQFVQLIKCGEKLIQSDLTVKFNNHFGELVLDTTYPYTSSVQTGVANTAGDSPKSYLSQYPANFIENSCTDSFRMYVMFKPPGKNANWVPLRVADWGWKWRAKRSGSSWVFVREKKVIPEDQSAESEETLIHPEWDHNYDPPSWVP